LFDRTSKYIQQTFRNISRPDPKGRSNGLGWYPAIVLAADNRIEMIEKVLNMKMYTVLKYIDYKLTEQ
jgi:hypothetical protein